MSEIQNLLKDKIDIISLKNFNLKFLHKQTGIYIVKSNDLIENLLFSSESNKINNAFIAFNQKNKRIDSIFSIIINEKEICLDNYELLFLINGDY